MIHKLETNAMCLVLKVTCYSNLYSAHNQLHQREEE